MPMKSPAPEPGQKTKPAEEQHILLTKDEAAKVLRCGPRSLDRRVADGLIPRVLLGGKVMFLREDLMAYIRANRGFGGKS